MTASSATNEVANGHLTSRGKTILLPSFLIIGAAKCGTTTVHDLLGEHPEIFVPDRKEPYFFARESLEEFRRWYEGLFDGAEGARAIGEASVLYTHPWYTELAAERIARLLPRARLIYMVRDPIRRLESDWKMRTLEGQEPGPLDAAIERFPDLVGIGRYWEHLSIYRGRFPDEQILVVFLEDFAESPEIEIRRIFEHVGADPEFVPATLDERRNSATTRRRAEAAKRLGPIAPVLRKVKPWIPGPIQDLGSRLLSRSRYPDVEWPPSTLAMVEQDLMADSKALLSYCEKPLDFWHVADPEQDADTGSPADRRHP